MRSIERWYFQWPWQTPNAIFKVTAFWSRISQKRCILGTKLLKNTNMKHTRFNEWKHFQCPWVNSDPAFKVTTFLKSNILNGGSKDKIKLLLHNRKVYVTYGMVLCLLTLTDLQTRRAGLSASADLLDKSGPDCKLSSIYCTERMMQPIFVTYPNVVIIHA